MPGQTKHFPIKEAQQFLQRLVPGQRILVALSGGSDSTGLLVALYQAVREAGKPVDIVAATVDHALRPESAGEALKAREICQSLGVAHQVHVWDGEKPKSGIMAAARLARYRLLQEAADAAKCTLVVTGHTLDDQLETVAMRRARKDEPDARGLAGMADATLFDGRTWIVRPFLKVRRDNIRDMLRDFGLDWIDDPSNENERYERVKVRNAPEEGLDIEKVIAAGQLRLETSNAAANMLATHAVSTWPGYFRFRADAAEGGAGQLALSTLISIAGGQAFLPGHEQVEALRALLAGGDDFRQTLSRVVVERRKDVLHVSREKRGLPVIEVSSGQTAIWDGRVRVANTGDMPVRIAAGADVEKIKCCDASIPPRVAGRLAEVSTYLSKDHEAQVRLQPYLAPFEVFLPGFDIALAQAVARLTKRDNFPAAKFWNDTKK